jgi:uncharacterized protein YvpB
MIKNVITFFSLTILGVTAISVHIAMSSMDTYHEIVTLDKVLLPVPYITQLPYGATTRPWTEACEEASALMVDTYYQGQTSVDTSASMTIMQQLFHFENQVFGGNDNTDAAQTAEFIRVKLHTHAVVEKNPSINDIQQQLLLSRPVIAFVNRFDLYQDRTKRISKTSYHVIVIIGFDDKNKSFSVYDPARAGTHTYSYTRLLTALHDYNKTTGEAGGDPVVLFTDPRT